MREEFFIKQFKSKYIGDDGAVVDFGGCNVIASDSFFEGVHFKREWMEIDEISYKASLVNISDMVVMNSKIKYAVLNVGFPKSLTLKEIKLLADGFKRAALEFGYEIIGGDTIRNDKISISVTMIGTSKKPVFRKARVGEFVAFTGSLGSVERDLRILLRGGRVGKNSKFIKPVIRDKFFYKASRYISAACDISDGLFKELERISRVSNVGYEFFRKFDKRIGCSGEEYEIVFTFSPKYLKAIKNIAKITRTPVTIFAKTKRGRFVSICKENHF